MNQCINCGKASDDVADTGFGSFKICADCEDTGNKMFALLLGGIDLEYSDGIREKLKCTNV